METALADHRVVVLVITYQEDISNYEKVSLQQCFNVLSRYPIRIVKPESVDLSSWKIKEHSFREESFPDHCFAHIGTYSRLLISREFYTRFQEFEYVLIYQLDAFVFRDELAEWCSKGFDFIGAPWFEGFSNNAADKNLVGVGNGGLSLRKVASHLRVLNSFSYLVPPQENWKFRFKDHPAGRKWLQEAAGFLLDLTIRNNTFFYLNSFMGYEDQFWSLIASRNFRWFKLPDSKEAMKFSFEMQPRRLFELNNRELPFGCHAWWKYDVDFWKPFICKFGYTL